MKGLYFTLIMVVFFIIGVSCLASDTKSPNVIETSPVSGNTDVDPLTKEITVTFDEPMKDGNWSWA